MRLSTHFEITCINAIARIFTASHVGIAKFICSLFVVLVRLYLEHIFSSDDIVTRSSVGGPIKSLDHFNKNGARYTIKRNISFTAKTNK